MAVIAMGTSMMDWARRCAVTMISSSPPPALAATATCCALATPAETSKMIAESHPRSLSVRILLPLPGICLNALAFSANLLMESLEQTRAGTFTGLMALLTFLALDLRSSLELHEMRVTGRMIPWVEVDPSDGNK